MRYILVLSIALLVMWLLWSGLYTPLPILFGVGSVALVVWIIRRMDVVDEESVPAHLVRRALGYWPWLLKEIFKSNIDVARRVLSPRLPISPCVFEVEVRQETALGRTILANSITLTPGTVSMSVDENRILVHSLTEEGRESLLEGEMNRKACKFEGGG